MSKLNIATQPAFEAKFATYPEFVRGKLQYLRGLVQETAKDIAEITDLEESLKWGEPSFLVKNGSTIRMDWKEKMPNQYHLYFKCTSRLVETFKMVFGDKFYYENNRALIFQLDDEVPVEEVKKCIKAALTYHKVKHLIALGI